MRKTESEADTASSGGFVPIQQVIYDWLLQYQMVLNNVESGSRGGSHMTRDGFDAWVTYNLGLLWKASDEGGPVDYGHWKTAFLRTHPESVLANSVRTFLHDLSRSAGGRLALSSLYRTDRRAHGIMALGLLGCLRVSEGKTRAARCVLTFTGKDYNSLVVVPVNTIKDVGEAFFLDVPEEKGTIIFIAAVSQTLTPCAPPKAFCFGHSMNPKTVKNGSNKRGWMNREEEFDPEFKEPTAQEVLDDTYEWTRELVEGGKGGAASAGTVTPIDGFQMLRIALKTPGRAPVPPAKQKKKAKKEPAPGVSAHPIDGNGCSAGPGSARSSSGVTDSGVAPSSTLLLGDKHQKVAVAGAGIPPAMSSGAGIPPAMSSGAGISPTMSSGAGIPPAMSSGQGPAARGCAVCAGCSPALIATVKSLQDAKDKRAREILSSLPVIDAQTPVAVLVDTGMLVLQTLKSLPAAYKDFLELAGLQEIPERGRLPKVVDKSRDYAFSRQGLYVGNLLDTMRREREETVPAVAPTVPGFCLGDFLAILGPVVEACEHGDLYQSMFMDICTTLEEPLLILLFVKRVSQNPTKGVVNFGQRAVYALNRGIHDFRTSLRYPGVYLRSGLHFDKIKKVFIPLHETHEFLTYYTVGMQRTYLATVKNAQERGLPVCCARYLGKFEVLHHRDFPRFLEGYNKLPEVVEYNRRDRWDKFTPREHMMWQHGRPIPGVAVKTDPL
jgi:hypothetical protein